MHGLTIVARSNVPSAVVLARSFIAAHPDAGFTVVITDAEPDEYRLNSEEFELIAAAELPVSRVELSRWAMVYDEAELREVLKPWAVEMLLEAGSEVVILLDPDIVVYGPLDEVESVARKDSIALVPHTIEPPARDALRPTEGELLAAGIYDLGFMAFGTQARPMLAWWQDGLRRDTQVSPHPSMSFTRRWIDLVPAFFDHSILRDPGYNVGYKNLDSRTVTRSGERLLVNGSELRFGHFTGYDPSMPWLLSSEAADNPRVVLSEHPIVQELCDAYADALLAAAKEFPSGTPYRYSVLDGVNVNPVLRELYRHALAEAERRGDPGPPIPFSGSDAALTSWFREPVRPGVHVNRFLFQVWEVRADLRNAFPQPLGADESAFVNWAWLNRSTDSHLIADLLPDEVVPAPPPIVATDTPGVNLAGYFLAELGVGEMARLLVDGIKHCDIAYNTLTTRQTASRQNATFDEASGVIRYPVTIAAVNADVFIPWISEVGRELLEGRYLAALWAWEVEEYPDYSTAIDAVDEIWTLSKFARAAIARTTDKPVHVMPLPVHQPAPPSPLDRSAIGIPDGPYFLFAFDYFSAIERKNPFAVIDAFSQAFAEGTGPALVIKTINGDQRRVDRERLRRACGQRRDIFLLEDYLDRPVVSSLFSEATAYVSLHRAEGFGLTIAEAMAFGLPVIATGYSGNLEFMTSDNSLLVPFSRVPIPAGADPYPTSSVWADADIDVAASYLRWIVDNPAEAAELGRRGRESVLSICSIDRTRAFLLERVADMLATAAQRRRPPIDVAVASGSEESSGPAQDPAASTPAVGSATDPEGRPARIGSRIQRARSIVHRAPDVAGPSRVPALATRFRKLLYRGLAHHDEHTKSQLDAVLDAMSDLEHRQAELADSLDTLVFHVDNQLSRLDEASESSRAAHRQATEYQRQAQKLQRDVAELQQQVKPTDVSEPGK